MPTFWKISNRALEAGVPSSSKKGGLTFWVADAGPLDAPENWTKVSQAQFKTLLLGAIHDFPDLSHDEHEDQKHVAFFVHGYNVGWHDAATRYQSICSNLFSSPTGLGICISFDWPSLGSILGYLPDRDHARARAGDLADVLSALYDWLLAKQSDIQSPTATAEDACKAKVSLIAHSMGNYLTQKALATVWTRKNQPLLISLLNQLIMVAADVDNDLFQPDASDAANGNAMANLSYRITSLYSGRDAVLGASAGLKHFGTRRLGRSGLAVEPPTGTDNVWDVDCSTFFRPEIGGMDIHSAYFETPAVTNLMRDILRGVDRTVLTALGATAGAAWPPGAPLTSVPA